MSSLYVVPRPVAALAVPAVYQDHTYTRYFPLDFTPRVAKFRSQNIKGRFIRRNGQGLIDLVDAADLKGVALIWVHNANDAPAMLMEEFVEPGDAYVLLSASADEKDLAKLLAGVEDRFAGIELKIRSELVWWRRLMLAFCGRV